MPVEVCSTSFKSPRWHGGEPEPRSTLESIAALVHESAHNDANPGSFTDRCVRHWLVPIALHRSASLVAGTLAMNAIEGTRQRATAEDQSTSWATARRDESGRRRRYRCTVCRGSLEHADRLQRASARREFTESRVEGNEPLRTGESCIPAYTIARWQEHSSRAATREPPFGSATRLTAIDYSPKWRLDRSCGVSALSYKGIRPHHQQRTAQASTSEPSATESLNYPDGIPRHESSPFLVETLRDS